MKNKGYVPASERTLTKPGGKCPENLNCISVVHG